MKNIILGSRGSNLALWQTQYIQKLLQEKFPQIDINIQVIETKGDKILDKPLPQIGGKGLFTEEIEAELLAEKIDIAVHSLKDLPTKLPHGLVYAGSPQRASVEDAFISLKWKSLAEVPENAIIATGSLRRKALVKRQKPKVRFCDLRGNIETRLRKLEENGWDGIIMAYAALERLGKKELVTQKLDANIFTPAVGQGAIGLEIKETRKDIQEILQEICCDKTIKEVAAERNFMRILEGGCSIPLGGWAYLTENNLTLSGFVSDPSGENYIAESITGDKNSPDEIGKKLAEKFIDCGARQLLKPQN